jgi:hypothetical protein
MGSAVHRRSLGKMLARRCEYDGGNLFLCRYCMDFLSGKFYKRGAGLL